MLLNIFILILVSFRLFIINQFILRLFSLLTFGLVRNDHSQVKHHWILLPFILWTKDLWIWSNRSQKIINECVVRL